MDYLKPFCENEYKIKDTPSLPSVIKDLPPFNEDGEHVSCDVNSLFNNIPVEETLIAVANECELIALYVVL